MYMHIDDKPSLGSLGISRLNGRALCEVREVTVSCPLQKHFPLFLSCNYARGSVGAATTSPQLSPRSLRKLQTSQALGSRKKREGFFCLGKGEGRRMAARAGGSGRRYGSLFFSRTAVPQSLKYIHDLLRWIRWLACRLGLPAASVVETVWWKARPGLRLLVPEALLDRLRLSMVQCSSTLRICQAS